MKKTITLLAALLLTGCAIQRPNALKVRDRDGITSIVRYPNAERYQRGETILVPTDYCGTYFAEPATVVQRLKLSNPIDDELSTEEVRDLLNSILN